MERYLETSKSTVTLTELVLKTGVVDSERSMRLESRLQFCTTGQNSLQFGKCD